MMGSSIIIGGVLWIMTITAFFFNAMAIRKRNILRITLSLLVTVMLFGYVVLLIVLGIRPIRFTLCAICVFACIIENIKHLFTKK